MKFKSDVSRREFISTTGKISAGLLAAGALSSCQKSQKTVAAPASIGADGVINVGLIGIRSRGWALFDDVRKIKGVHVKALCDVDGNVLEDRLADAEKDLGYRPDGYSDMRDLLKDASIHAVIIATPNHWHALATIWACQAGKHVYVEKPVCHNLYEGRKMVEAARKYNCLVQAGFQNRSIGNVRQAMKFLHDGGLGEVYMARGLCYKRRDPIGKVKDGIGTGPDYEYFAFNSRGKQYDAEYMAKVNYDYWTGPADLLPFSYNRFHYNWHWNWNYGGGDSHNQGPHQFDIARWGLNKDEHPVKVCSAGGLYGPPTDQNTPNIQTSSFEYADGKMLVFETRGMSTNGENDIRVGNLFFGTKGWMHVDGSTWKTFFGPDNKPGPSSSEGGPSAAPMNPAGAGGGNHMETFIAAVRSGQRTDLTAEIEEAFMSSALPIIGNAAYRLGRTLEFDGRTEKFIGDSDANALANRKGRGQYMIPKWV
jgi:predicted dehydrogenase